MKIKNNRNLYLSLLIMSAIVIVFIGSLAYFLGFDVNVESLLFYLIFLFSTFILFFVIFLIIDVTNKKYLIFDDEKIILKNKTDETVLVYLNQILYTKYHNFHIGLDYIETAYAEIVYKIDSKDATPKSLWLSISKSAYKKIFGKKIT